jgi:hypothetical protein
MENSSDEEIEEDVCSVASEERHFDQADAHVSIDKYVGCQDHNLDDTCMRDKSHACDDDSDPILPDNLPVQGPVTTPSKCWLCTFSPHPTAVAMHSFIVANVASMDFEFIASQIKHEILGAYPHARVSTRFTTTTVHLCLLAS